MLSRMPGVATFAFEAVSLRRSAFDAPWLASERLAVLDETVIVLADRAQDIERSLWTAHSAWHAVAVASDASCEEWLRPRQEWTREEAERLVAGARCVALTVYDGESLLLWRPARAK